MAGTKFKTKPFHFDTKALFPLTELKKSLSGLHMVKLPDIGIINETSSPGHLRMSLQTYSWVTQTGRLEHKETLFNLLSLLIPQAPE